MGSHTPVPDPTLEKLALELHHELNVIQKECTAGGLASPSLAAGSSVEFWSEDRPQLHASRERASMLLDRLTALIRGPHEFAHEFVASNWDHGALYVFLHHGILDHLAGHRGEGLPLAELARRTDIPSDKLFRILRLLVCRDFVAEIAENVFELTLISEGLVQDADFRAWVEFQLYDTRVASAHLADALAVQPNDYQNGASGFKQGWGMEMYEWHAKHSQYGDRFKKAMKGVSSTMDPADALLHESFSPFREAKTTRKAVELGGRYGFASTRLAKDHARIDFEVRAIPGETTPHREALLASGLPNLSFTELDALESAWQKEDSGQVSIYIIRNLLWNWKDDAAVKLLQSLLPTLRSTPGACILVTDGVSPSSDDFAPGIELGYRRRDITTMTMHNQKQRTQQEWLDLFHTVDPTIQAESTFKRSSHVFKGLWQLRLGTD